MTDPRPTHRAQASDAAGAGADDADANDAHLTVALLRALQPIGGATIRRLGGLRGLFHVAAGDVPFGVISRGEVFFKAGPDAVTKYIASGMRPLRLAGGRMPLRGYWRVPPDVLEDAGLLALWATRAVDVARQFGRRRPARLKRKPRGGDVA
jgi:TfoX/Sxy family transcriptional regulator of competence genes